MKHCHRQYRPYCTLPITTPPTPTTTHKRTSVPVTQRISTLHYVSTKQSFNATTVSAIISITITPNLYSTSSKRTLYAWCNFYACLYYLTL